MRFSVLRLPFWAFFAQNAVFRLRKLRKSELFVATEANQNEISVGAAQLTLQRQVRFYEAFSGNRL